MKDKWKINENIHGMSRFTVIHRSMQIEKIRNMNKWISREFNRRQNARGMKIYISLFQKDRKGGIKCEIWSHPTYSTDLTLSDYHLLTYFDNFSTCKLSENAFEENIKLLVNSFIILYIVLFTLYYIALKIRCFKESMCMFEILLTIWSVIDFY